MQVLYQNFFKNQLSKKSRVVIGPPEYRRWRTAIYVGRWVPGYPRASDSAFDEQLIAAANRVWLCPHDVSCFFYYHHLSVRCYRLEALPLWKKPLLLW